MSKSTVKRCVRPQCMEIYPETIKNRYCLCGALIQTVEIEVKPQKNNNKKTVNQGSKKEDAGYQKKKDNLEKNELEKKEVLPVEKEIKPVLDNESRANSNESKVLNSSDFEGRNTRDNVDNEEQATKAYLYLLLDDDEVEFELTNITRIGRRAEGVQVDFDLSEYAGKDVSREHAVIRKEKDAYYITNVSQNHSVKIIDQDDNEVALEYGKKVLLKSEDGILLSKKILLQFVEEM